MSQTFMKGVRIPVTFIKVGPCVVTQIKKKEKDGYWAVQVGFGERKIKKITKPLKGHLRGAIGDKKAPLFLREIRLRDEPEFKKGEVINASDVFGKGDIVVVTGISKGKGFAGVVKRWGFAGGPKTHGQSDRLRAPGAIGQGTSPGRVHKGKKMAGRMGGNTVTLKNLFVIDVDKESGEVKLSGSVPGKTGGLLRIEKLGTKKLEELIKEETQRVVEAEVVSDGDSKKSNTGNVENSSEDSEKKV